MVSKMNTVPVPCRGGLNLSSNIQELLQVPGEAISLVNFECSKQGGYRRVTGTTQFGSALVPGTSVCKGVKSFKGALVGRDDSLYHSFDGDYWLQVNKNAVDVTEAGMLASTTLPRTHGEDHWYQWADHVAGTTEYVLLVDGVNNPAVFSIKGDTRATAEYRYADIVEGTALVGAKYCTMYKDQFVIAGMTNDLTSIFYSSFTTTNFNSPEDDLKVIPQENFNGSQSGSISVGEEITGIVVHREALYVFCVNSIHKITGLDTGAPVREPVTRNIGCVSGFSIQEVGGDVVFLAPDGLRTLAKTERIGDIELGVISRKVDRIFDKYLLSSKQHHFVSTVVRGKNQYRLWFHEPANPVNAHGIIAAYTYNPSTNASEWCFSELAGLQVTNVNNSYVGNDELILSGDKDCIIVQQEKGINWHGSRIAYEFQSPYTDFGDTSLRKNIHKSTLVMKAAGDALVQLEVKYDYEGSDVHQPAPYYLEQVSLPAIFGDIGTEFGQVGLRFGSQSSSFKDSFVEGSGKTVSVRIRTQGVIDDAPFDIQSFAIQLTGGGKI